jgi:16S rRNA G1207 methylase RsmC
MQQAQLECANRQLTLIRPGAHPKQPLQAWDAADEYLINVIFSQHPNDQLLVLNDQFGALGCALHEQTATWASDSFCAKQSLLINLKANQLTLKTDICDSLTISTSSELAIMKIPKNLSFLDFQLNQCAELGIKKVLLAGMMKHLPKTLLNQLQKFGDVSRLPFVKKATVFELLLTKTSSNPYPKYNQFYGVNLSSHANVFGRDKLDPGAQFFLEHLEKLPKAEKIADLCCGSGILGIKYALMQDDCKVDFYDESFMAVESSKVSWQLNTLKSQAGFFWEDGLNPHKQVYDLILCNPPFHEAHTVGDHIAKRLFEQSKSALKREGKIIVVGNRHLQYHLTLKKYFKHVDQIASNPKFILLSAYG